MESWDKSGIPIQLHNRCIIASFQVDLTTPLLKLFRQELLDFVVKNSTIKGVILDLSGLEIIDISDFNAIRDTIKMIKLTGFTTVISGLRPAVVSSLIVLDADIDGLNAALSLDEAIELLLSNNRINEN
ncbi:STAS domain-containing protein [Flammeovirga kamogawensis]|uniref:STAS domain-containing protein n=1 Tax=Flammeovirga kamogawensis TaxID=373891 RepID=A0ABX8H4Q2_9BACT|nr:STAS domain-containing protein [Flammeovirga kamogawensis]MBB6461838.1 rsbT antagonist protein RsbS [Flammeovirga kamogawensis]QWG10547.1 STAS domain-containing protein [Flammeovirga kamogawensis]TRX63655.1 STAS domain-containing protein [Flammeovirga kamogawensis]